MLARVLSAAKTRALTNLISLSRYSSLMLARVLSLPPGSRSEDACTRELSIRKIVGAGSLDLAKSLLAGFAVLVVVAVLIAVPSAYFLFDKFLLSMVYYRAPIGFPEIILSVMSLLVTAGTVLGSQLVKVVRLNPAETLKAE